jgi:hypothetical protein
MGWCRRGGREGCIGCGIGEVGCGSVGIVGRGCVCGSGCEGQRVMVRLRPRS